MKPFTKIICLAALFVAGIGNIDAQYLQFIENKGQWDSKIKFKGELNSGAFYLHATGYKIVLEDGNDLTTIREYFSGHDHLDTIKGYLPSKNGNDIPASTSSASAKAATASKDLILHSHAYEVTFIGASPNPEILPEKTVNSSNNYFIGNDPSKWVSGCKLHEAVVYKNIYPNIDVRYYTDNGKLKCDFIVNPGGDPNQILLQYSGTDGLSVKNQNLIIKTSVGDVTETKPYSYEVTLDGKKEIAAKYIVKGNLVKFNLGDYTHGATVVIDPSWVFSTFTGSKADNWGYTATYDGFGNFYAGGIVFGSGYPVTSGAFQTSFGGGNSSDNGAPYDIGISKFNPSGSQLLFSTYIGGNGNEQPHSLIVDNNGDLVIAGRTNSTNFPVTSPTFGPGGDFDIYVAKLSSDGKTLKASRLFGGSGSDGVNVNPKWQDNNGAVDTRRNYGDDSRSEVIVDGSNNIIVVAQTQSSNFQTTTGVFQPSSGGGQDGVVIKVSNDLKNVLFSSYLGGSGVDAAFVVSVNPKDGNIYVAGGTTSSNFPGVKPGVLYPSYGGGRCDGFVAIVSSDGSTLVNATYIGKDGNDLVFGIQFDKNGFPYIMGTTTDDNWPVINAAFSQPKGKEFIGKMQPNLSGWIYSTVFGKGSSTPDISPTAFLVDQCERVYVSGWGGDINRRRHYENSGTGGLTTTSDALIPASKGDGSDFYFIVLEKDASSLLYATMFGQKGGLGDHVDGGTSRFDKQGVIYQAVCANCGGGASFPVTASAYSTYNGALGSGGCNLAAVKIAFELSGVITGLRSSINGVIRDTSGCVPLTVDFRDTVGMGTSYEWDFGDGSPAVTTTDPFASHTYTSVGLYKVRLVAINMTKCNPYDTTYLNIRARTDKAGLAFTSTKLPPCQALTYQFDNLSTFPPGKPFTSSSFLWDFGDGKTQTGGLSSITHTYLAPGTYTISLKLLDTSYCNEGEAITRTINIASNVKARFKTPDKGCAPYSAVFTNESQGGQYYVWDFGDGNTLTTVLRDTPVVHTYPIGTYTAWMRAYDPETCNQSDSTFVVINVYSSPTAGFTFAPSPPKENTPIVFYNSSSSDAVSYLWDFGDGETFKTTSRDSISHIYNATGPYKACLIAYNSVGCPDTTCQEVQALVSPLIDIPTAFTPNGDGINDIVRVRGYGIYIMSFKIYNRWGILMYQSANTKDKGWDGRYKGTLQPQDVYTYILDVEFTDGTKVRKTGDITLLR